MSDWNAEEFYEENRQNEATFIIATQPMHEDLRSTLNVVLSQILHMKIGGYGCLGVVHTDEGDVHLSPEQYADLLRMQQRFEDEQLT
ncbi:hypothetical protein [Phyllobacterium zundukense]|uniref:Uncharacterized protein n=1 Tax=Phyllobacterium zundukense TaxID=1867719 RepID=A0ACD4D6K6_9HYPH|nr:hypothetical protein [Phyllobacterium zundukense]UXN61567.1 hypothetical protein N8E88_16030 [Phyllobacterium zundukense]